MIARRVAVGDGPGCEEGLEEVGALGATEGVDCCVVLATADVEGYLVAWVETHDAGGWGGGGGGGLRGG